MNPRAVVEELRARLSLMSRSSTLLIAVVESGATLPETRTALLGLLRAAPLAIADLGACQITTGPRKWVEMARATPADAYALSFVPDSPLAIQAFGRLLNAERELLRDLNAPFLLFTDGRTEQALRERAPDFFTWTAAYALPAPADLRALAEPLGVAQTQVIEEAPLEDPIRFLHISDIHLRPGLVKRYDQDRVLSGLVTFLTRDRASFPLDMIFVTGDLAQSGRADEYALVAELLQKILEITGVPRERMFVVPGNHDVDRGVGQWLLRTLSRDEESISFFADPQSRKFHEQKMGAYRREMEKVLGDKRPLGIAVGQEAVETVEIKGSRISVASFNTAWFAQGDDDTGKLWLGEPSVERALERIADDEASLAIALMHHPFENLHETERDVIEHWFERGFDLVLRGHLHASKTRSIAGQRGGFVEVACPATYQGSPWPNGCFLGEIRPRARKIKLRPYMYTSGPDPWVLDTKVFPDDEKDGYCREFKVPEKKRLKSPVSRALRKAAEDHVRGSSPIVQQRILEQTAPGIAARSESEVQSKAVSAVRALAETPELWTDTLAEGGSNRDLIEATIEEANNEQRRMIGSAEPGTLRSQLKRAARVVHGAIRKRSSAAQISEKDAMFALFAALTTLGPKAISQGQILIEPLRINGVRAELIIGASGEELIAVGVRNILSPKKHDVPSFLDHYARSRSGAQVALFLVNSLPRDAKEPRFTRGNTPEGRDLLIIRT